MTRPAFRPRRSLPIRFAGAIFLDRLFVLWQSLLRADHIVLDSITMDPRGRSLVLFVRIEGTAEAEALPIEIDIFQIKDHDPLDPLWIVRLVEDKLYNA